MKELFEQKARLEYAIKQHIESLKAKLGDDFWETPADETWIRLDEELREVVSALRFHIEKPIYTMSNP